MSKVKDQEQQTSFPAAVAHVEIYHMEQQLGKKLECNIYYAGALIGAAGADISSQLIEKLAGLEKELIRFTNMPNFPAWEALPGFVATA